MDGVLRDLLGPVDWRSLRPSEARAAWQELRDWVEWLNDRYALDHRVVPPCWYRHPALVEVLTALRDHHRYAFDPMQLPTAASEWHRVFRDLEPRLRDWASRTGCTRETHRPDVILKWPDDAVEWEAHLAVDEQQRRRSPSDDQQPARE